MRRIQKTFSLEPMTSRMPSVLPAYKDNKLYYFDNKSLKAREYEFPSNYGMIPVNIALSGVTVDDDALSASTDWSGVTMGCSGATISFERLSNLYHFFKEYYHLLNDYGHCSRTYSSATEYYYYESGEHYADQMIYGTNEQTYIDLDTEFSNMGGIVDVDSIASGATDIGFYRWICDNIIPTYYISKDYVDYWKRKKLYYPDVIKWIAWLGERLDYEQVYSGATENEIEHWDCKNSAITNCCDCEEYFNRGGKREYDKMKKWYDALQGKISGMNEVISASTSCFTPSMDDKIQLYNSLDDLGQYSIFSKEYELGIDYRTASYGDSANTHGGTVIEVSGETMILKDDETGFCFSPHHMEKIYDEEAWDNYTDKYMSANTNEFVSSAYTYYTFDDNGVMYTANSPEELSLKTQSAYTYDIEKVDAILIDGVLYDIQKSEYGEYDKTNKYIGGKKFFVYREKETSTPYTLINGKKIYAEFYPYAEKPFYYFTFFKNEEEGGFRYKQFERRESSNDTISYISYQGQIFEVDESGVTINNIDNPRVSGYAYNDNEELMYCISGQVVDSEFLEEIPNSQIIDDKIVIGYENKTEDIYNAKELTGHTLSRLTSIESTDVLIDDIGNKIDGKYNPSKEEILNHQPPEGTELELLYQVGNTSMINRFSITSGETNITTNYFIGNIITDMVFYYKDVEESVVSATTVDVHFEDGNAYSIKVKGKYIETAVTSGDTSLSAITASTSARTEIENDTGSTIVFDGEDIYCDVTYYIGATLSRTQDTNFVLAKGYNYGVEYKETVKFVKEDREYYLKKAIGKQIPTTFNSVSAHTLSYPIYVYKLTQELQEIDADVYNTLFQSPIASFKTEINLIDSGLTSNYDSYRDISGSTKVSPTFKQEYMLGISSLENIDSDIYIERGINAAFEKHLKLGEVTSLEALEQYSNGYFKIMNS